MNAYGNYEFSVAMLKTYKICCGNDKKDVVFTVEVHTGIVPRSPLGTRPGLILHSGPSHKEKGTVLAAAGAESMSSWQYLAFNPRSVIMLPPIYARREATSHDMTTEIMRGVKVDGSGIGFAISLIVVGPEPERKPRHEEFLWRKNKDGYELMRLLLPTPGEENNYRRETSETVAMLKWPNSMLGSFTKAFSLELKGSALSGALGERCVLMIVVTACRILMLRQVGKTTEAYVTVGDKTHRKEANRHDR